MKKNSFARIIMLTQLTFMALIYPIKGFALVVEGIPAPGHSFIHFYYNWTINNEDVSGSIELIDTGVIPPFPPGITDVRQTITMDDFSSNTMSLAFFNDSNNMIPLDSVYGFLGLSSTDSIYIPDFCADLNGDGYAETHLYGAVNISNLVKNYSSLFVNDMPFAYYTGYHAGDFTRYGYVFSVNDNITYAPGIGFQTTTPLSSGEVILITDIHGVSNPTPEPSTCMLFGIGALGIAYKNRRKSAVKV